MTVKVVLFKTLAVIIGSILALSLAEAFLRLNNYMPEYADLANPGIVTKLNKDLLFTIKPRCRADINKLGFRDREFDSKKSEIKRAIVLGDSFVFGQNVNSKQTFTKIAESLLGGKYELLNLGVVGYGPDQSFIQLKEIGLKLKPDLIILCVFPANDFNDLYKNELFSINSNGILEENHNNPVISAIPDCRLKLFINKLFTGRYLAEQQEDTLNQLLYIDYYDLLYDIESKTTLYKIELMNKLILAYSNLASESMIPFATIVIPCIENIQNQEYYIERNLPKYLYFHNETIMTNILKEHNITHIDLSNILLKNRKQHPFDENDHHLSVDGHSLVANELTKMILSIQNHK